MLPPDILLPYQAAWINDRSPVKIWEKSRRIGASYAEALASVLEAAKSREAGGMNTYYLSYNKDMTQQFIKDCAFWARALNCVCEEDAVVLKDQDKDITVFRIRFGSGFEIWGLPSEARSLRSKQGRVIIDEAAFVDDLKELLKAAMALLMWGGCVRILSTHNGEDNEFNELIKEVRAGRFDYSLHRTSLDDAIADGLFRTICRSGKPPRPWSQEAETAWRDELIDFYGDGADEELFCIPSRSGGAYFTTALIESCMSREIPVIRWKAPAEDFVDWPLPVAESHTEDWCGEYLRPHLDALPADCAHYFGEDFGRSGDLSVQWPLSELSDLSLRSPFVLELHNAPFRTQQQILKYIIDRLPRFSGGALDARGNGQALAEFARQEYGPELILEVMISEAWYREAMPKLKARFEDRAVLIPQDKDILEDFRQIKVIRGVARAPETRTKGKGKETRHADAPIAAAMAVYAREQLGRLEPWDVAVAGEPTANRILRGF